MDEEERIRQWKAQLQREMADDELDDDEHGELISKHPVPAPQHFDDEPLSDDEAGAVIAAAEEAGDDDLGLDLEEPAYRDKAPAHPSAFELPKGVATRQRTGYAEPELAVTQATIDALRAALHERDIELERLRRAVSAEPDGAGRPDDLRDQRLRELARKNRQLTQVVGKERAQQAALAAEVASLRAAASTAGPLGHAMQTGRAAPPGHPARAPASTPTSVEETPATRELRDKLASATAKLSEARQAQQALRAELAKVQRALAKEVGDDVPLAKVLDDGAGWRGRAQQITLLRAKLAELRRTATAAGVGVDEGGAGGGASSTVDERARGQLASIEQDRRREFERLALREQELISERADDRAKLDAVHARVKILEAEARSSRERVKLLLTKSENDDELVQALKAQLCKAVEKGGRRSSSRAASDASAVAAESAAALAELGAQKAELVEQNERQEQIILFLRDQLSRASIVRESEARPNLPPPHDLRHLEVENGKLRELAQLLQDKLARAMAE
ncbi:hypothetical protein KFE25_008790 [Diacronema lutheri]|uniref:Uncharacterized protein n=1 Tax=Diacronema lutheri TaxID=2081491 RepID=A0A8J5XTQ2_DIALT|nr:hypothetical protein KFE25_008790 [Diacronema lutheri]